MILASVCSRFLVSVVSPLEPSRSHHERVLSPIQPICNLQSEKKATKQAKPAFEWIWTRAGSQEGMKKRFAAVWTSPTGQVFHTSRVEVPSGFAA
jgi:hypothetical protein